MYDINNLCFLCLIYDKNISPKDNNYFKVQDELQYLIPEQFQILHSSELPKYVCSDCKENVLSIKKFRDSYVKNIVKYNEYVQKLTAESGSHKCLSVMLSDSLNNKYLEPNYTKIKGEPCDIENLETLSDREEQICETEDFNLSANNKTENTNIEQILIKVEDTTEDFYEENENLFPQDARQTEEFLQDSNIEQVEIKNENDQNYLLIQHIPGNSVESQNDSAELSQNSEITDGTNFQCNKCSKTCSNKKDLEKHSCIQTEHKCEICHRTFIQLTLLTKHKATCNDEKPHECDVCQRKFKYLCELRKHQRSHTGEKSFTCDVCQKKVHDYYQLKIHKRTHTGEKPYECDVCQKRFSAPSNLNRHKRVHTGDKPYKCDVCQKAFTSISSLHDHIRSHTKEKPYKCDVCQKAFGRSTHLRTHKMTHTGEKPYECDVCQKTFTQLGTLQTHKITHSSERPYVCDICQKTFRISNHLKIHKWMHTGEHPFQCDVCQKKFTQLSNLKAHKLKHCSENQLTSMKFVKKESIEAVPALVPLAPLVPLAARVKSDIASE